jgi:hypothetical protein
LAGSGGVQAVDLGGLDHEIGADLDGAQRGGGVGGEEGVAGAGCEDHDAAFLEVADGAAADVVLADLVDLQCTHHPAVGALLLDGVLQGERIHDGGQHAHVVGRGAVDAALGQPRAAKAAGSSPPTCMAMPRASSASPPLTSTSTPMRPPWM